MSRVKSRKKTKPAVKSNSAKLPQLDCGQACRNHNTIIKLEKATFDENEAIPYWQQQKEVADAKKAFALSHPWAGKIVKRMGEYGVIVVAEEPDELQQEYYIRFDNKKKNDMEGLWGGPFDETPDYELKYINLDGTLKI